MAYTVSNLMNTSVDDCKSTLGFIDDLVLLRQLLAECKRNDHKSRARVVESRIRTVEKAEKRRAIAEKRRDLTAPRDPQSWGL